MLMPKSDHVHYFVNNRAFCITASPNGDLYNIEELNSSNRETGQISLLTDTTSIRKVRDAACTQ